MTVETKTTNEEILDAVIRHQIFLMRYSASVRNRMAKILNKSEDELARRIRDAVAAGDLNSTAGWRRLSSLLAALSSIRKESWVDATKFLIDEMEALSYHEPIMLDKLYATPIPVHVSTVLPSANLLKSIALARPFEGRILKDWAAAMQSEDIRRIHSAVQAGMVAGEDHATIARRVVGTARVMGTDGVTEMTRSQMSTVVRTAVQHIANGARDAFFDANSDILTSERFVATLDSRTTAVCRANDGKIFLLGKGPRPPLHFNCRSLRIAAIDETLIGSRPAKPTTEKILIREYAAKNKLGDVSSRADLPRGSKTDYDIWSRKRMRELVGPVAATETYQTWLKKQSIAFQEEVLGKTKAKLFREGGLKLDRFVDNSGRELTLKELAAKHDAAFRAAGLDPKAF